MKVTVTQLIEVQIRKENNRKDIGLAPGSEGKLQKLRHSWRFQTKNQKFNYD